MPLHKYATVTKSLIQIYLNPPLECVWMEKWRNKKERGLEGREILCLDNEIKGRDLKGLD